jgi:hypothetical protein
LLQEQRLNSEFVGLLAGPLVVGLQLADFCLVLRDFVGVLDFLLDEFLIGLFECLVLLFQVVDGVDQILGVLVLGFLAVVGYVGVVLAQLAFPAQAFLRKFGGRLVFGVLYLVVFAGVVVQRRGDSLAPEGRTHFIGK